MTEIILFDVSLSPSRITIALFKTRIESKAAFLQ